MVRPFIADSITIVNGGPVILDLRFEGTEKSVRRGWLPLWRTPDGDTREDYPNFRTGVWGPTRAAVKCKI
jgi:hypothetical protein